MSPRQTMCETSCDFTSSKTTVNASKFEWISLMTAMAFCMDTNTSLGGYRQPDERQTIAIFDTTEVSPRSGALTVFF